MDLSLTSDYVSCTGDPLPELACISRAGFSHVHWCHEWNTKHLYSREEIDFIGREFRRLGLKLLDLHAPHGTGMGWGSTDFAERKSSLALISNRIYMTGALGGVSVVLHIPAGPDREQLMTPWRENLVRSLDSLTDVASCNGVRIALENMPDDDFAEIEPLLEKYPAEFLGLCYDSGHGNIGRNGLDGLERFRLRLASVHIHDNDGISDRHLIPFTGTADWPRLARLVSASSYAGCVSLESNMRCAEIDEPTFLANACRAASRLSKMIEAARITLRERSPEA